MKESAFQIKFTNYLRKKKMHGFFELKQTNKRHILFSALQQHQIESLRAAEMMGLVWKLSDADPRVKPFDCVSIPPLRSYVVIRYDGGNSYILTLDTFLAERDKSEYKSLEEYRASELAELKIQI